jgi:hypothetical protein
MGAEVGVVSSTAMTATNTAILAVREQLKVSADTTVAVAGTIVPPTNDSASAQATMQEITMVNQFKEMLDLGLQELQQAVLVTEAYNTELAAQDIAAALATAAMEI